MRTYLDHNATTPLRAEAREAMLAALDLVGSASSMHAEGRAARRVADTAREQVAALVGAEPGQVVFVSGATEANALALAGLRRGTGVPTRRLASMVEHASVGEAPGLGFLPVDPAGRVEPEDWRTRLAEGAAPLVSLMLANNETGVVQPVAAVAAMVREHGGVLHCDASQAAGKLPVSLPGLGADALTLSSHKLGGPFGAGALVLGSAGIGLDPLLRGGGQEAGLRAGTENLPALAGFGAAAAAIAASLAAEAAHARALREALEAGLQAGSPDLVVFGREVERLPNTSCFAEAGIPADTALLALDLAGIAVSSGSACSSGTLRPSHVLAAMGVAPELARCAVRVSFGRTNGMADVHAFLRAWNTLRASIHTRRHARIIQRDRAA